jgi:FAD/FMN-containing dehydrogenase
MTDELLAQLRTIVGDANVVSGETVRERPTTWETHQPCHARALLRPADTGEVATILRACNAARQSIVPYGGLTNLVQGCATSPGDIVLSFERMNAIEETDAVAHTMTAQAGVTLQAAQEAADLAGLFFPIDIGARGECLLGGNVATNAGGTKVIRYGMTRDSVLGIEAVLADGTVISSMNRYIKNNSGFDLKHLFIGTEGLLGIVTRIVFRLHDKPLTHNVALVTATDYGKVVEVLTRVRRALGGALTGFEVMWGSFYRQVTVPDGKHPSPVSRDDPFCIIIEAMGSNPATDDSHFEETLAGMFADELIRDGVMAKSQKERDAIWAIRGEVEWIVAECFNFDVSLRITDVGAYVDDVRRRVMRDVPRAQVVAFGHLGDNNVHISVRADGAKTRYAAVIEKHVYESLTPYGGAISAEHGIGLEKKAWLSISRSPEEIALMRTLKRSLDPNNILNPGKVFDLAVGAGVKNS